MNICGKVLTDSEFEDLVLRDENFVEFVKTVLDLKNEVLSEKLDNFDSLKQSLGISYKGEKTTLFKGEDDE